jgi:prevent-host-death family protein
MTTHTVSATEFKARCLDILDRLAAREFTRVTVTKRGRPVAVLCPPDPPGYAERGLYGFMEGTVSTPWGYDFAAPALEDAAEPAFAPAPPVAIVRP